HSVRGDPPPRAARATRAGGARSRRARRQCRRAGSRRHRCRTLRHGRQRRGSAAVTKRRSPMLLIVLLASAGTDFVSRQALSAERAVYSTAAVGWMPSAPSEQGLTETWFCPGVPATGVDDVGGSLVIANRTGDQLVGTILVFNEQAANRRIE